MNRKQRRAEAGKAARTDKSRVAIKPLSLAAPRPLTEALTASFSEMLSRIYQFCRANRQPLQGLPDVTWNMDLGERALSVRPSPEGAPEKLHGLTFAHCLDAAKEIVGSRLEFRLARGTETYCVRHRVRFDALQFYLTGREFERTFPRPPPPVLDEAEWDRWGYGLSEEITRRYETIIYPRVLETLEKLCARAPGRRLFVVDLGGGAGQLAERICASVPGVRKVLLLERSAALLEKARARAARHPGRMLAEGADITDGAFLLDTKEAPDVIIACGVVAAQVMDEPQGLRVMRRCYDLLPARGVALVPSYSPALLSSREYEAMGFTVHNKTLSVIQTTPSGDVLETNDFYILEKA
jgi:hypothetical protein